MGGDASSSPRQRAGRRFRVCARLTAAEGECSALVPPCPASARRSPPLPGLPFPAAPRPLIPPPPLPQGSSGGAERGRGGMVGRNGRAARQPRGLPWVTSPPPLRPHPPPGAGGEATPGVAMAMAGPAVAVGRGLLRGGGGGDERRLPRPSPTSGLVL